MSATDPPRVPSPRPRTKRLRRWVVPLILLLLVLAGYAVVRSYTSPDRIKSIAETYLQQFTRGRVSVGGASFSFFDGVRLYDMIIQPATDELLSDGTISGARRPTPPVFSCRETKITHDLLPTLLGNFSIKSIVASQPTCWVIRDAATGRTTVRNLFTVPESTERKPGLLPTVYLRDARIAVVSREQDADRTVTDLKLSFRALPARGQPGVYDIVWEGGTDRVSSGHSQIDLHSGRLRNVRGGLPWLSIEAVMLALDAQYDGAGAWSQLLGLDGTVRASDYTLGGGPHHRDAASAVIELRDASLSIPIDTQEQALPANRRYLRFERVNGRTEVTPDRIVARFDGTFHGSECNVVATFRGRMEELTTLQDVGFDAKLTAKHLTLPRPDPDRPPAEIRFIKRWQSLVEFYADYDPHGTADLEVELNKQPGKDQRIVVQRLLFTVGEGDASCRYFPYRLSAKGGSVEYTPEGLWIHDLHGEREGGTVLINGHFEEVTYAAAKEVRINGTDILIDDALADALPSRFAKIGRQFDARGRLDIDVTLTQPRGDDRQPAPWRTETTIKLDKVSAAFDRFPYRADDLTGALVVADNVIRVEDVAGVSGDGRIQIDGAAACNKTGIATLDLKIRGQDVAFDDNLFNALPQGLRDQLRAFAPTGRFGCDTAITLDPGADTVRFVSRVALHDAGIKHRSLPLPVHGITGRLVVTGDNIAVEELTGRYNDATIRAEGSVGWGDGPFVPDFVIRAENLQIDNTVLHALAKQSQSPFGDWQIEGLVSAETTIRPDPNSAESELSIRTVASLEDATIQHPEWPAPLRDVHGDIHLDGDTLRATDVQATYGNAELHSDIEFIRSDENTEVDIKLSATGVTLDDSLRALLPPSIARAWEHVRPEGSINLRFDSLHFGRPGPDEPPEWTIVGYVELDDVNLPGLADLEGLNGVLVGTGKLSDALRGASLRGDLSLTDMKLYSRRLHRVEADWSFARAADGRGFLVLEPIEGAIYDGLVTGKVDVAFDQGDIEYNLSTTVQGMQIGPFVNVDRNARLADRKPIEARGLANVHLYLSGSAGAPSTRQGGGRFEVLDGHIYRLPIILAILNVLNLSVPDGAVFDDARAEFFIAGDRMQLRDISLRGSILGLVGSGTLSIPDRGVDLSFVNVGPRRWSAIPLLSNVIEGTSRDLVELHVTGPLARPTVRARPFRGVQEELERLFQKRKPRRIQPAGP